MYLYFSYDITGLLTGDITQFPSRMQQLHHQVKEFVNNKIIPLEREIADYHDNPNTKWTVNFKIEQLKVHVHPVSLCVCNWVGVRVTTQWQLKGFCFCMCVCVCVYVQLNN